MALTKTTLGMVPPAAKMPLSRRRRPAPCYFLALFPGAGKDEPPLSSFPHRILSRDQTVRGLCVGGNPGAELLIIMDHALRPSLVQALAVPSRLSHRGRPFRSSPCFVARVAGGRRKCSSRRRGVRVSPGLVTCVLRRRSQKGCHGLVEWKMENGPVCPFRSRESVMSFLMPATD
ncbi:hypothetical protein B0T19DRAFT_116878 [Cercophora scortea]|uniref:Uncharacterized protein n=1 Tax=Cercophora scortea TaxID=314031 RepID=A0AAE0IYY0_9PEZI|nr:hypothetical protein B0T19DRAFT_116878 [Cercophora scortea]